MTLSKENLQFIEDYDTVEPGEAAAMARELLALRERAEPFGYYSPEVPTILEQQGYANISRECAGEYRLPLYTTPPAPVVPDERAAFNAWNNEDNLPIAGVAAQNAAWLAWQARATLCGNSVLDVPVVPEEIAAALIAAIEKEQDRLFGQDYLMDSKDCIDVIREEMEWLKVCRAAMLQGAEQQNAPQNIPENIPTLRDAVTAIRNSGIAIDANKIQAERDALNALDVPDGWALVPVEPTQEMIDAHVEGVQSGGMQKGYRAMLAAAPAPGKEG